MIPPPRSASRRDDEATELRNRCIGIETIHEFATCNPVSATIRRRACVAAAINALRLSACADSEICR